jgi:hypothetical protein
MSEYSMLTVNNTNAIHFIWQNKLAVLKIPNILY